MKLGIAVCEDEGQQAAQIAALVKRWAAGAGHSCALHQFASAEALLFAFEDAAAYDILLLDVELRGMSGIQLAKQLRAAGSRAEIIFITAHFELAGEGYEVDALHYLPKPLQPDKLQAVLDKAAARLAQQPPSLLLRCEGQAVRLCLQEIVYVESFLHYLEIHTLTNTYKYKESMAAFEARLGTDFFRVHRSYLVALEQVQRILRGQVWLTGDICLPLARGRYEALNRAFIQRFDGGV